MHKFKNAEIRKSGHVIRTNVDVDSYVPITGPNAANTVWSGVLRPPNNIGLAIGDDYTLILPGFSPAKIRITSEANPADGSITFDGVSDLMPSENSKQVQNSK